MVAVAGSKNGLAFAPTISMEPAGECSNDGSTNE